MKRNAIAVLSVAALSMCFGAGLVHANRSRRSTASGPLPNQQFTPVCSSAALPGSPTAIDQQCGLDGSGTGAEAKQNDAKNNFCATGTPEPITIAQLVQLQNRVTNQKGINFGDRNTPTRKAGPTTKRAPLEKMGEGNLVVFRGYVLNARQEGAESVNCGRNVPNEPVFHDIHISLGDQPGADECSGFVAEMIPHGRPASWTAQKVLKLKDGSVPIRVTGQLMFDSSHVPCAAGRPVGSNPARASLWEIHPIYKFEVCTSGCDGEGQWISLEEWSDNH